MSIFTGHILPNIINSEIYDAVDSEDSFDSYLRKDYKALIPYLTIDKKQKPVKDNEKIKKRGYED